MTTGRQLVSTGTIWEEKVGYSRAVRVDRFVAVSGTTAADENSNTVGLNDPAAQTDYIIRKIEKALIEAGSSLEDVTRLTIYVTRIEDWQAVGEVLGSYFRDIRPASTLLEVSRLVSDELLVEISADAIIPLERAG